MSIFSGQEYISNHGTKQGIIPRFLLQPLDMAKMAFDGKEAEDKFDYFLKNNISDFTNFYDLYEEIKAEYNDFKNGLSDGRYFSIKENGQFVLDRSVELQYTKKVKEFFINGRLLLLNFAKCGIVDSEHFKLNEILLVKDSNFEKNRAKYIENEPSKKFERLFNIVFQAREVFLTEFINLRAKIEHENMQIPTFKVNTETGETSEPSLLGIEPMLNELDSYYENILFLVDVLFAFYFGIEAKSKSPNLALFQSEEYDYSKLNYEYSIFLRMQIQGKKILL